MKRYINVLKLLIKNIYLQVILFMFGFSSLTYYGMYKPYERKREEIKSIYEEKKKLRDEYKKRVQDLKSLMKEEERLNNELMQLKDKLSAGGDENTIVNQVKALLSDKAKIYGLTQTSLSQESTQELNGIKKVRIKANYTSKSVENILRFIKDIEDSGLVVENLSLGVDNMTSPGAYYVELRVYRLWIVR
ncbi:hypothetical protein [Hydrogenobacter thermophilus]|uniref:hypothetical protein n=1 Tax=Hydrogenobacter thermophilus TaxID=940 RepID=UPI0030FC4E5F